MRTNTPAKRPTVPDAARLFHHALLLVALAIACNAQVPRDLGTFLQQEIGLRDSEIVEIERGKAVAKILDSRKPSEIFVFGAVLIQAPPDAYVRFATDLNRLKALPNYLAIHSFSDPPVLGDLDGFAVEANDIESMKRCRPDSCDLQLPAETIEAFRDQIDWSGPDPASQVNRLAKKMALDAALAYRRGGNSALGAYRDKKVPSQVSEQFRDLLSRSSVLPEELPEFYAYLLDYPHATFPGSSSLFYWEKVQFGLKPTVRINQQIVAHTAGRHGPVDVVAIKQLYASHYFQSALDLNFCIPAPTQGFYLVTLKGSVQAGLTGPKGNIVRKVVTDKTRSSLQKSLQAIKSELETSSTR
jgi:hypothetical protein